MNKSKQREHEIADLEMRNKKKLGSDSTGAVISESMLTTTGHVTVKLFKQTTCTNHRSVDAGFKRCIDVLRNKLYPVRI